MRAKGGVAAGQRQNGPGPERLDGLANGRVCREAALNALESHAQRLATDVVELTLLYEGVDARARHAQAARGFDRRERPHVGARNIGGNSREGVRGLGNSRCGRKGFHTPNKIVTV